TLPPFDATELAWNNRQNLQTFEIPNDDASATNSVLFQSDEQLQSLYLNAPNEPAQGGGRQQAFGQPAAEELQQRANPPPQSARVSRGEGNLGQAPAVDALAQDAAAARWSDQFVDNAYGYGRSARSQNERGASEFARRNKALQTYGLQEVVKQRKQLPTLPAAEAIREGVSAALWINGELLLARLAALDGRELVQGCWFDWPRLRTFLIAEGLGDGVGPSLPQFDLQPIVGDRQVSPARRLATLPVEIVAPQPVVAPPALSPIRLSLWIAWGCMFLATGAVALLLRGVVSLSERRAAFVSAVTHELRTPLTTFRMYAEMLSEGIVRDPLQQRQYTNTLRVEADRLSHLVENVLAYARLERGRKGGRRQHITVGNLLDRVAPRLSDRSQQAEMNLCVEADAAARDVVLDTDPQAVE
ncbi:MAG: hypothetical protein KDA41_03990, partial [Planctomycetales bacterium]|nr:hypothetical protein [Planctomycetales bacterium]